MLMKLTGNISRSNYFKRQLQVHVYLGKKFI